MKKNTMRAALFIALLTITGYSVNAQNKELKVGNNPTIKQPSAVLEVESTNKGMLMPRVTLTSITDATTIATPANALTVFNTATAGTAPNDVTPGYYYWSTAESKWIRLLNQEDITEPWRVENSTTDATTNVQNIYQNANVGIGDFSASSPIAKLDVRGAIRGGTPHNDELNGTSAIGTNSIALGYENIARGNESVAFGYQNSSTSSWSTSWGMANTASNNYSTSFGYGTRAGAAVSTAWGTNTMATHANETVFGRYNAITNGDNGTSQAGSYPLLQIGNGDIAAGVVTRGNALTLLQSGRLGLSVPGLNEAAKPTELLDLGGTATTGYGGLKIRNINSAAYTGNTATDKVVVADASGVLKTVAVSAIAPAQTNTTLSIVAGQLVYANEQANNANVNLISADADNTLVAGTDGRLFVPEPTVENIYNADGTLTGDRIVTTNSNILRFEGTDGTMKIDNDGESEFLIEAINSNTARTRLTAGTGDLQIAVRPTGNIDISANPNGTNSLSLGTSSSANPSSNLEFYTVGSTRMAITGTGDVAIGGAAPTEKLDIQAGNVRVRDINANIGTGTDRVVVSDTDGVLKTIPASTFAATNIYNADGTLTAQRTVSMEDKQLTFIGDHQETTFSVYSGLLQEGKVSSPYDGRGSVAIYGADKNADNRRTALSIQSFADGGAQLYAYEGATLMEIGTNITQNAAPIIFTTSAGGFVNGSEKMRITGTGEVGIVTTNPTEKLDVGEGNLRVREINTNVGATTDRIVVADANGVLKTIAPSTTAAIRTETANYAAVATDETILVNATAGTVVVTLPAAPTTGKKYNVKKVDSTSNTVTVNGNGRNIDGMATVSGTLPYQGWVMQYDGANWFIISRI